MTKKQKKNNDPTITQNTEDHWVSAEFCFKYWSNTSTNHYKRNLTQQTHLNFTSG